MYIAKKLLKVGEVKNVFFNIGENEAVIDDRMLILLQCKQLSPKSGFDRGGVDTNYQVPFSHQVEDDRQEIKIISPFKLIVVDIAKIMTSIYRGRALISYQVKEDSELLQIVDITFPYLKFEDMILDKTFFTRKFGIIG